MLSRAAPAIPLFAALVTASCSPLVSGRNTTRVPADAAAPAVIEVANVAPPPSAPARALPAPALGAPRLRFASTEAELRAACTKEPADESNLAAKEAFGASNGCLEEKLAAARAELSAAASDARRAELASLDAAHDHAADDLCWVSEEMSWTDLEHGLRDDGSLRGYRWLACQERVRIELTYLSKTIRLGDAPGFAEHVASAQLVGARERATLESLRQQARALVPKPVPVAASLFEPQPLTLAARQEYVARMDSVARASRVLAAATCAAFADLARATGGDGACESAVATHWLSLGRFGGFEEEGDED